MSYFCKILLQAMRDIKYCNRGDNIIEEIVLIAYIKLKARALRLEN